MSEPRTADHFIARWPIGSCPECYDGGRPERPICAPHAHDLVTIMDQTVTLCDYHEHTDRAALSQDSQGEQE